MKKLMMTSDEYYHRKKIDDYMDEKLRSSDGCRRLAVFTTAIILALILSFIFFA